MEEGKGKRGHKSMVRGPGGHVMSVDFFSGSSGSHCGFKAVGYMVWPLFAEAAVAAVDYRGEGGPRLAGEVA